MEPNDYERQWLWDVCQPFTGNGVVYFAREFGGN
jgi:hypothetical protein